MVEFIISFKEAFIAALLLFSPIWVAIAINAIWKMVSDRKNSKRIAKRKAEKVLHTERLEENEHVKF